MPFASPGDLPDTGIEPGSPELQADVLPSKPPGETLDCNKTVAKSKDGSVKLVLISEYQSACDSFQFHASTNRAALRISHTCARVHTHLCTHMLLLQSDPSDEKQNTACTVKQMPGQGLLSF